MAQRVVTHLIDDLDGESEASETLSFGLDGASYEIDLSDQHAAELRDAVSVYVGAARRAGGKSTTAATPKRRQAAQSEGKPDLADIRAWARENGHQVSDRGRVSGRVLQAYKEAH